MIDEQITKIYSKSYKPVSSSRNPQYRSIGSKDILKYVDENKEFLFISFSKIYVICSLDG